MSAGRCRPRRALNPPCREQETRARVHVGRRGVARSAVMRARLTDLRLQKKGRSGRFRRGAKSSSQNRTAQGSSSSSKHVGYHSMPDDAVIPVPELCIALICFPGRNNRTRFRIHISSSIHCQRSSRAEQLRQLARRLLGMRSVAAPDKLACLFVSSGLSQMCECASIYR